MFNLYGAHNKHATMNNATRNSVQRFQLSAMTLNDRPMNLRNIVHTGHKFDPHQQLSFFITTTQRENPYVVLNIPANSNYTVVKAAFIKAALQHHPDHSKLSDCTAAFVRIRRAFEEIASVQNSSSEDVKESNLKQPMWENDAEFHEWFETATCEYLAFEMNNQTRQEVIHVHRTMSHGGLDRGGHWEMARMLTEREDAYHRAGGCDNVDSYDDKRRSEQPMTTPAAVPIRRKRNR